MAAPPDSERRGILAGGNFIIDYVKIIDGWPGQDMLTSILSESSSNGGGPYNVLKDFAALGVDLPLEAVGVIGNDTNGHWIVRDCEEHAINTRQLHRHASAPTSYTDAMTVESTGRRTFFHQRGANAFLGSDHFDFARTSAKLFHLGYLMLLDRMDEVRPDGTTEAAEVLTAAQEAGLITSVDCVSTEDPRFTDVAIAAMPHADYFIANETEASLILGRKLCAEDAEELTTAAGELCATGNCGAAIIHTEFGAVAADRSGESHHAAALLVPQDQIKGATGAGDAFATGLLYGIHEERPLSESLGFGVSVAAASLNDPTPSGGIQSLAECVRMSEVFPKRDF